MNLPYTEVSNIILRDPSLSLPAKGLYLTLRSFAGLEGFCLTKKRLKHTFASSGYGFQQAWKELKTSGYFRHSFSTAENGAFLHVYDLYQTKQPETAGMSYAPNPDRPHGDLRFIPSGAANDYTTVPDAIARDGSLSLKVKGLYAVLSYLFKIPDFHFCLGSLRHLCKEGTKALKTIWTSLKCSGLLKQHRHPTGEHNRFAYTYDLLLESDLTAPYFTNHRADGTITSSLSVDPNTPVPERKRKRKNTQFIFPIQPQKSTLSSTFKNITRIQQYPVSEQVDKAIAALCKNKHMRINGARVSLEERQRAIQQLTPERLEQFELSFKLPSHIRKPIPYIASALYQFTQEPRARVYAHRDASGAYKPSEAVSDDSAPLTMDEMDCILRAVKYRIKQADTGHTAPQTKDVVLTESYAALLAIRSSLSAAEFEQRLRGLCEHWKNT